MFSNGSHTKQLKLQADKDRNTLNELLTEFNTHRTDSKAKIYTKDAEIALLKKKLKERQDRSVANGSEMELIKWKSKVKALEQQIHTNKTASKSTTASEESERLKTELKTSKERNRSLQEKITELNKSLEDLKSSQSEQPEQSSKALELKDQEIAALQQKLKKAKKKAKKQKNQPAQKWQVEELLDLIKKGKLK